MSEELDMSPAARWARVEAARIKAGLPKNKVSRDLGFSQNAYIMAFKDSAAGKLLRSVEKLFGLPVGPLGPKPGPKPGTAVFGFDHALARILDQHHIGEPGDHIMLRLGILSERLKNIGGEK